MHHPLPPPWGRSVRRPFALLLAPLLALTAAPLAADDAPPRLSRQQAVTEALQRNPALQASREQVEQARARVSEAKALPDVTITRTIGAEQSLFTPRSASTKDTDIDWTLPFPTRLRLAGQVARAELRAAEFTLTQLRQQTAAQTVQAYDALLVAERHRRDLTEGKGFADDFLKKTQARYDAGAVAKLDLIKARVDLAQAENALIANERAVATARAGLNRQLGRAPGALTLAADDLADVPPPLPDLASLTRLAFASRPEILSAAVQREGARFATRLARQYWLPDVNLTFSRNQITGEPTTYSTAIGFAVPLFFWQHNKGGVAEAQHHEAELEASGRDTAAQVELDVRTSHAAADTARRQALYIRDELLPEAKEAYRIAGVSYGLGGSSALELLDAKRTLLDAQSQYTDALGAACDALADLERAVGSELPTPPRSDR